MGGFKAGLQGIAVFLAIFWAFRPVKQDWKPNDRDISFKSCPSSSTEVHVLFGGTSMLGRYIVDSWKREFPSVCLVNYNRKPCKKCDVSVIGDIRDSASVDKMFDHYKKSGKLTTVISSVKPELLSTTWRTFLEVNFNGVVEVAKSAKKYGVNNFIYASSIAASGHYMDHHLVKETDYLALPRYTTYEAPYDLSKRQAEDVILSMSDNKFKTVAIRLGGIIGGDGDQFFHHRLFPFTMTFNSPIVIDYNFAGNIADAFAEVSKVLSTEAENGVKVSGQFFYYTGEHVYENVSAAVISEATGKPLLQLPHGMLSYFLTFWQWFRWDHETYTLLDLVRMAEIEQTFDQTKFHTAFPNFKQKYTVSEALRLIYSNGKTDAAKTEL